MRWISESQRERRPRASREPSSRTGLRTLDERCRLALGRGIEVVISVAAAQGAQAREPMISRRPELIHGLRNLVQNAVDFAKSRVWIDALYSGNRIVLRIVDDGSGEQWKGSGRSARRKRRRASRHGSRLPRRIRHRWPAGTNRAP